MPGNLIHYSGIYIVFEVCKSEYSTKCVKFIVELCLDDAHFANIISKSYSKQPTNRTK